MMGSTICVHVHVHVCVVYCVAIALCFSNLDIGSGILCVLYWIIFELKIDGRAR